MSFSGKTSQKTRFMVESALIAALYAALTYFGNIFGLSYGPIQLRFSEVLTVLPAFTPAGIVGLTVGCFLANIASFNPLDMLFGTAATLLAAVLTYLFRKIRLGKIPFLSLLPPIFVNGIIIGAELCFFWTEGAASWPTFFTMGASVALGEAVVLFLFGIPFCFFLERSRFFGGCHLQSR